jgi:hypothetical protein
MMDSDYDNAAPQTPPLRAANLPATRPLGPRLPGSGLRAIQEEPCGPHAYKAAGGRIPKVSQRDSGFLRKGLE